MFLIVCLSYLFITAGAVFDCGRPGTALCQAGSSCDMATGRCVCVDPTLNGGPDCGLVLANVDAAPCTGTPCENGGSCVGDGTDSTCYCPQEFTGSTCQTPRYNLVCGDGEMTLSIIPYGDFSGGVIFIEGDPNCTLTRASTGDPFTLTLPHTGGTCIDAVTDPKDERYKREVAVLYNNQQVTGRDELVIAVCGNDLITAISNITVGVLNQGIKEENLGFVPVDADINFELSVDGRSMSESLSLGDDVTVRLSLTDQGKEKYQAMRIENCAASNNLPFDDPNFVNASFIGGSCHTDELTSVTLQPLQRNADTGSVSFVFEAFKFRGAENDELLVTCLVKMCDVATDCAPVACTGDPADAPTGLGRRRRDVKNSERTLGRVLAIKDPFEKDSVPVPTASDGACSISNDIIGVLIAMGTIICFLFVVCTLLAIRVIFFKSIKHVADDTLSQSSTTRLASSPSVM